MIQLSLFDLPPEFPASPFENLQSVSGTEKGRRTSGIKKPGNNLKAQKNGYGDYAALLVQYLPEQSLERICELLERRKVAVKITGKRHSKLGDYRSPHNNTGHRITINSNLNRFSFLITLVHELAHLSIWEKHRRRVKPHGKEWKAMFRELLMPFVCVENFPSEILPALKEYLRNPAASATTNTRLMKILKKFDASAAGEKSFHLEDLSENAVFSIRGGSKTFVKGKQMRKRFLCRELNSKRKYLVSPVAEVVVRES